MISLNEIEKAILSFKNVLEKSEFLNNNANSDVFKGLNLSEVHCIDVIGKIEDANVTKISNKLSMTRGAVSKITRKLLSKNFICKYQKPENKKEIYFQLTNEGRDIFNVHEKLHKEWEDNKVKILNKYDITEVNTILNFLQDINEELDEKLNEVNKK